MDLNTELQKLEDQQRKGGLSFEEVMDIKDRILELQYQLGKKEKPKHSYFQCTNCSA